MGLGSAHTFSLREARDLARQCRQHLSRGINPLEERKADRLAKQIEAAQQVTFQDCANSYCAHKCKFWEPLTVRSFERAIRLYLNPDLGKLPIATIDHLQIARVIEPLWEIKPATAAVVWSHLKGILDYAKAKCFRTGDNPASLKGPLGLLFPGFATSHSVKHHRALPSKEIGTFMSRLRAYTPPNIAKGISVPAELLQFIILTAVRVDQAVGLRWSELDFENSLWTCPWQRTKTGKKTKKPHLVPLSKPALAILKKMQALQRADGIQSDFVFVHIRAPARRHRLAVERVGKRITNGGVLRLLKIAMARKDLTVHGFRTTFSSWANDVGGNREAIEMALDHVVGNQVERIYARDAKRLDQRRKLMEEWAEYCGRNEPLPGDVIPFRQAM
jgi:integrase